MSAPSAEDRVPAAAKAPTLTMEELLYEPGVMLGSGSAVMYQLAVWGVGKGVAEHSDTLQRPLDRLRTTLSYVYVMALGTEEEKAAIARMVNRRHGPVKGDGYTAYDPELQLWVAATLAAVGQDMYERIFGRLDDVTRESLYREAWVYGTALQVKPEMWPPTYAEFEAYWERMEQEFRSDDQIRHYARSLLSSRAQKWYVRPTISTVSLVTRGNLSPRAREALGLPWSDREQKRYDRLWSLVRTVYPWVPRWARKMPAKVAMRDIRWRMRTGRRVI